MQNSSAPILNAARRVVRSELNSYDLLSRQSKLRYEQASRDFVDANGFGPDKGYVCGHNVSLCSPCDKCSRSQQDCVEYQIALQSKLKELLKQLNKA